MQNLYFKVPWVDEREKPSKLAIMSKLTIKLANGPSIIINSHISVSNGWDHLGKRFQSSKDPGCFFIVVECRLFEKNNLERKDLTINI